MPFAGLKSLFGKSAPTGPRFGYAVVGLGHIAKYFIEALQDSPTCAVTALVSGNADKARKLAAKHNVPRSGTYDEFEAILGNPAIDAVYIALPVSLHREFTERAARAGKHVLCEKPMAPTAADAQAMIEACRAANVLLSIAYRCPHTPLHQRAKEIVQSGVLGTGLKIESGFGFVLDPGWRDAPTLAGGGSLFDVGIYPLNSSRFLLGENPTSVQNASAVCDSNGLERSVTWTSIFPSGAEAVCSSSYDKKIADTLRITGSNGFLLLDPAFSHREQLHLRGEWKEGAKTIKIDEKTPKNAPSDFRLEAEYLAKSAQTGTPFLTPGEDGLADMVAMEAIYAAAGV